MTSQSEVGDRQVQQALRLQTQGQDRDQESCPNDKCEVAGHQVPQTEVREGIHWSLPETVWPPTGRQMLVVWRDRQEGGPDAGTPLPPLQPVERPANDTTQAGGKGDSLESGQMQTRADL